jgi:hypothetical protein
VLTLSISPDIKPAERLIIPSILVLGEDDDEKWREDWSEDCNHTWEKQRDSSGKVIGEYCPGCGASKG